MSEVGAACITRIGWGRGHGYGGRRGGGLAHHGAELVAGYAGQGGIGLLGVALGRP